MSLCRPLRVLNILNIGLLGSRPSYRSNTLKRNLSLSKTKFNHDDYSQYIPRRAVLYVPGNDERKLAKISKVKADCIVMDCEDGVALSKKDEARNTIHKYLQRKEDLFIGKDCSVRVNGIDSDLFESDLEAVLAGPLLPTTLLLPKVESQDHVLKFSEKLKHVCKSHDLRDKFRLILYVESAKSLLNLQSICESALTASERSPFILDGVVFGSDDFCADIGATRTSKAKELSFARQWTLTVAKAFKLQAIDVVYIDFKDLSGLKEQSDEGAQFGFTGKQVIHPSQIDIVQTAFSPSPEKLRWAQDLVVAFRDHQQEGKGAFTFHGNMIDMPLLLQAQNILRIASVTKI
ncbi:UNVERIFIED_CONTAM: hypothetical protein GTU68_024546 [Idotea baltica]|nr:hypothetical protein [Idotea baltica]